MKKLTAFLLIIFITQSVFADMICDTDIPDYFAVYEPDSYTCSTGYFLPAHTDGCQPCPSGGTCPGGTFNFNENYFQGLHFETIPQTTMNNVCAANFPSDLYLVYEPNEYTCNAGYYLPANVDACTICPAGSACAGGTYSFNETTDQGIVSCTGTFSPSGSAVCYPHILHVGNDVVYLKSTKQTTPSLNFRIGGDVFYANMTTTRTRMSKDSTHYFHAKTEDNVHYYICDDTTYGK